MLLEEVLAPDIAFAGGQHASKVRRDRVRDADQQQRLRRGGVLEQGMPGQGPSDASEVSIRRALKSGPSKVGTCLICFVIQYKSRDPREVDPLSDRLEEVCEI